MNFEDFASLLKGRDNFSVKKYLMKSIYYLLKIKILDLIKQ